MAKTLKVPFRADGQVILSGQPKLLGWKERTTGRLFLYGVDLDFGGRDRYKDEETKKAYGAAQCERRVDAVYEEVVRKENFVFEETLTFDDVVPGGSSSSGGNLIRFIDSQGHRLWMRTTDFAEVMRTKDLIKGKVHGRWTFTWTGQQYAIILVD